MNSGILFGFKDLINSSSSSMSLFDLSSLIFSDNNLKSISPKRYRFYIKFLEGLSNPAVLQQFFYKTKDAKVYKEELNEKIMEFTNIINKLNSNIIQTNKSTITTDVKNAIKNRFNLNDDDLDKIDDMMKGGFYKGEQPMRNFINAVNDNIPELNSIRSVRSVDELLEEPSVKIEKELEKKADTVNKAKVIYERYKDDVNLDLFKITLLDRGVFIGTTFLIRFLALMFINWGLSSNLINSFHSAFVYYCGVYLLLFLFVTMLVNVIIAYPVMELFTNNTISNLPNLFYYFYVYTNGYIRLIIHIIFILIILFIPYIINIEKIGQKQTNISFNYDKKKQIYDSISIFSLIIWILTSIIAFKF